MQKVSVFVSVCACVCECVGVIESVLPWLLLCPTHCGSNWILITRPASILGMMDSYHAEFH